MASETYRSTNITIKLNDQEADRLDEEVAAVQAESPAGNATRHSVARYLLLRGLTAAEGERAASKETTPDAANG